MAVATDLQKVVEDAAAHLYVWALKDIPQDLREIGCDRAHASALSAAARPALRPKTQHSSSELPIIRFRPCVPPAISPHA